MNGNEILEIFNMHFRSFSENTFEHLSSNPRYKADEQLYHYTSLASLENIIRTETIRATSIYMMNDPNELVHGYDQLSKWFSTIISEKNVTYSRYKSIYGYPAFVFCLTELDDDMYYWDKYGDMHKGVRIGFTPDFLMGYWSGMLGINAILVPVVYQRMNGKIVGEYAKEFEAFRDGFVKDILEHCNRKDINNLEKDSLEYCIALIASMIKREEWSIEKEWRILCIADGRFNTNICGSLANGYAIPRLNNTTDETHRILTNKGHSGLASKDVIKIGSLAGNKEYVEYVISLIFKEKTGINYFNDRISQSFIQIR